MRNFTAVAFLVVTLAATSIRADDGGFELPLSQPEHQWLEQFVGEWTTTSQGSAGPDQPTFDCSGTISSRMIGGYWVVNEMSSDMPGMQMRGLQTIGYDSTQEKYIGTWVDSILNHMWHYEGTVDESGKKLSLYAEGPIFAAGEGVSMFRDSYEFVSDDQIRITSEMQGDDGEWITFMTGDARRNNPQPAEQ